MHIAYKHCGDLCSIHKTYLCILHIQKLQNELPADGSAPTKTSSVPSHQGMDLGPKPHRLPTAWTRPGCHREWKNTRSWWQTDRSTKKKLQICLTIPADTASKCCSLAQKQLQTDLRLTLSLFPVREEKGILKPGKYFSHSVLMSSFKPHTEATQCNVV